MHYLISIIYALSMVIYFTMFLSKRMKTCYYTAFFLYLFCFYCWVDAYTGQWGTFLIVLGAVVTIYWGCQKQLLEVVLALCGYLIAVFLDHLCTIPLSFWGITIRILKEYYIYIFLMPLITFFVLRILRRRFILPKLPVFQACPNNLLLAFLTELLVGISLLAFQFIYGDETGYPSMVLSWNGIIISALLLTTILIFYNMYAILERNQQLNLQKAQAEIMQDYTRRMESFYEEVRIFRHDYRNILSTLQHYIDSGDIQGLQAYYHDKILSGTEILSDNGYLLGKLHLVEDPAVKSLLYTKIISILNHKLAFDLELQETLPPLPMDSLSLCRILGILMDNAIEASLESGEKMLRLAVFRKEGCFVFIIANSTQPLQAPLSRLNMPGYSTKAGHDGLGLASVAKLIGSLPNVLLSTEYNEGIFRQILKISLEEKAAGRKSPA